MYSYPILFSENVGTNEAPKWQYRSPYSGKVMDGKMYTVNGFWDTYRTEWPALSLLTPTKTGEILDGLLLHFKENFPLKTSQIYIISYVLCLFLMLCGGTCSK